MAEKTIRTALCEMEEVMLEKLEAGGTVSFSPKGVSMLPMLRDGGDSVTLKKPPAKLKRGTVALFVLTDVPEGRKFILHRYMRKEKGLLVFCGDNRVTCDPPVPYENVLGVVTEYVRSGRKHSLNEPWYKLYTAWMVLTPRIRRVSMRAERLIYRIWKRISRRSKKQRTRRAP